MFFYLASHGASVSMPIETRSKELVECIYAIDGSYFIISAFDKAPGRRAKIDDFSPEFFIEYGKVIGKFHKLTKLYVPSENIQKRFIWHQDQILVDAKKYLKEEDFEMINILKVLMDDIKKIPINNDNYGLIHTDNVAEVMKAIAGLSFGEIVDYIMKYLDITVKELEYDSGLSDKTIRRYINGQNTNPDRKSVVAILRALNLPPKITQIAIKQSGISFKNGHDEDDAIYNVLLNLRHVSASDVNKFMTLLGFDPLTKK